jgi:hypothetical protein
MPTPNSAGSGIRKPFLQKTSSITSCLHPAAISLLVDESLSQVNRSFNSEKAIANSIPQTYASNPQLYYHHGLLFAIRRHTTGNHITSSVYIAVLRCRQQFIYQPATVFCGVDFHIQFSDFVSQRYRIRNCMKSMPQYFKSSS